MILLSPTSGALRVLVHLRAFSGSPPQTHTCREESGLPTGPPLRWEWAGR